MNKRNFSVLMLLVLLFAANTFAQKSQRQGGIESRAPSPAHKVVLQLSSADTLEHRGLLNNIKNLKEGWGDSVAVEVVVHGPGIALLTKEKTTFEKEIQKMIDKGVRFVACRNTMKQRGISEEQIIPNAGFVQMGVGEIILKQEQGWSYLKAGF